MKSLKSKGDRIAEPCNQLEILDRFINKEAKLERFEEKLAKVGLFPLKATGLEILQVNMGKMCNQTCAHCHVDAGPDRKEIMGRETLINCLEVIKNNPTFHTIDLTGGAPEMNPLFLWFVEELSKLKRKIIVRSNLTILVANKRFNSYPEFFAKHKVTVIASLPCYTADNTDKQRGEGVFLKSIQALKSLNDLGYGVENSGLEIHLVYNPIGPHLPPAQEKLELDYKMMLEKEFGIIFNKLYTITNMPISRYLDYLIKEQKYEKYMELLVNSFNIAAAINVMCRNTLSVGWDGRLYDCDFNQMLDLQVEDVTVRKIKDFNAKKLEKRNIVLNQHCYGCTAGSGSSCQGALN